MLSWGQSAWITQRALWQCLLQSKARIFVYYCFEVGLCFTLYWVFTWISIQWGASLNICMALTRSMWTCSNLPPSVGELVIKQLMFSQENLFFLPKELRSIESFPSCWFDITKANIYGNSFIYLFIMKDVIFQARHWPFVSLWDREILFVP